MKNNDYFTGKSPDKEGIPPALIFGAGMFSAYLLWDNLRISVTRYTVSDKKLPRSFDGFKIIQVSDLHSVCFGKHQSRLVNLIRKEAPDMIAITGDLVRDFDMSSASELIKRIVKTAPCFYVSGNHEYRTGKYFSVIKPGLRKLGVKILDDTCVHISRNNQRISVIGLNDPCFEHPCSAAAVTDIKLTKLENDDFTILLSHRPELARIYSNHNVSLALAGHAHGGQFQIPFIKRGVYAPQQGFFPKYTNGLIRMNNTNIIVSRGLGTQTIIPRFNNPPELVSVTLRSAPASPNKGGSAPYALT